MRNKYYYNQMYALGISIIVLAVFAIVIGVRAIFIEYNSYDVSPVKSEPLIIEPIEPDIIIQPKSTSSASIKVLPLSLQAAEQTAEVAEPEWYLDISDDDAYLVAQIVYLEARGESYECQQAVTSVILNRMTNGNKSARSVIFAQNQFSTASSINSANPSDDLVTMVKQIFKNGPTIPTYVTYFRAGKYHQWNTEYGRVEPYMQMDGTYFSYDYSLRSAYFKEKGIQE